MATAGVHATPTPTPAAAATLHTLFDGPKSFWRTRQTVDLRFVEHVLANTIEIISYETDLNVEGPRIYLDSKKLYARLDATEIDEKINAKREEYTRMRKRVPVEELRKTIMHQMAVAYISVRLQIAAADDVTEVQESTAEGEAVTTCSEGSEVTETDDRPLVEPEKLQEKCIFRLEVAPASGDPVYGGKLDMVLRTRPPGLEDIVIPRRKKTTMADFHSEMRALKADHAQLNHACSDAQRKAGLAVQSTDAFKNMLKTRSTMDDSHFSIAKRRWMWATHRVILQNYVAAVHRRLERYSLSALPSESISKSGQELKDRLKSLNNKGSQRQLRGSASSVKLPSLSDSSRDARDRRSSRDGNALRASLKRAPRELAEFSKSLSAHVQERVEARAAGRNSRGSRDETNLASPLFDQFLPTIGASNKPFEPAQ